jgi:hypothetical protein
MNNDYGRISKVIMTPNDTIIVKINISLYKYVSNKETVKNAIFTYDYNDKMVKKNLKGIFIDSDDYIGIQTKGSYDSNSNGSYVYIQPQFFHTLLRSLKEVERWLKDREFASLFTVDTDGNTVGLSNMNVFSVVKMKNKYLMFKPAVIYDEFNTAYQGVQLKSDAGIIGNLTSEEFLSFLLIMTNTVNNFQTISLELLNIWLNIINNKDKL